MQRILAILALTAVLAAPAAADTIVIDNGDTLSGSMAMVENGIMTFNCNYAGRLQVQAGRVRAVTTGRAVTVHMHDGRVITGRLQSGENNTLTIVPEPPAKMVLFTWREVKAINPPPPAWHGSFGINAETVAGNLERLMASLNIDMSKITGDNQFLVRADGRFFSQYDVMLQRNSHLLGKYNRFFTARSYWYLMADMVSDSFKDLALKSVLGGGAAYVLFARPRVSLTADLGLGTVAEDFIAADNQTSPAAMVLLHYNWNPDAKITITDNVALFGSLDDSGYSLRNDAVFQYRLGGGWSLRIAHILDFDSRPPANVKKTDVTLRVGLNRWF